MMTNHVSTLRVKANLAVHRELMAKASPITLGNMREMGVLHLLARCLNAEPTPPKSDSHWFDNVNQPSIRGVYNRA